MKAEVFESKANSMGDFYVYYEKDNVIRYSVCTTDFSTPYISKRLRQTKVKPGEVLMWNWTSNRPLKLPLVNVRKLTPLSAVLKNV